MLETLALMGQGFIKALTLINLLAMVGGVTLGIIIGCLPGLSAAMGVALMLPLTFTMPADTGLIVLGAIYCGAIFGGSISAILIHTPGTPASAATAIEGYQMTLKGQAGKALATACWSSFWGGLLSCISLYFFAPLLAQLALKFMSAEKFWLGIFGLTIIAGVSSKSIVKGLMSGALGLLLSTIGLDPIDGTKRFMFGHAFLAEGINTTCALIGLFSMSQVLILAEKKIKERQKASKFSDKIRLTKSEKKMLAPTVIRSWIIGNIIGILPGAGASIACFMGYNNAKQFSKHKEDFGHGAIEGVCGSEAANNAVTGGSLIPMLTLGIPGDSVTAILIGALTIHGLQPGPTLMASTPDLFYYIVGALAISNVFLLIFGLTGVKVFTKLVEIPKAVLLPAIVILSVIGVYAINNNLYDIFWMVAFGVLGYFMKRYDYPVAPTVLGLILASLIEKNFRRAIIVDGTVPGMILHCFTSPISLFLILVIVFMFATQSKPYKAFADKRAEQKKVKAAAKKAA